jgi:hypothetical protein
MVTLPGQGPVWRELNTAIQARLSTHSLSLPNAPDAHADLDFHNLPWILLEAGRLRTKDLTRKYQQSTKLDRISFTGEKIVKLGQKTPCTLDAYPGRPVIWLGEW